MKKLYSVELVQRMYVVAESEEKAVAEAKFHASYEDYEEEYAEAVLDKSEITKEWCGCIPYGGEDEIENYL